MLYLKHSCAAILILLSLLILPGSSRLPAAEPVIELRLGAGASAERLAGAVAASLNNAVPGIDVAVPRERTGDLSAWQSLQNGVVDLALVDVAGMTPPPAGLAGLNDPSLFMDADAAERFYTGAGGARIAELLSQRGGVTVAGWIGTGGPRLLSRIPLESAEALRTARIAVRPDSGIARDLAALGAAAVPLPVKERLDAFFGGAYDVVEAEDISWAGERKDDMNGVLVYDTDSAFPYLALCLSGSVRSKMSSGAWTALLEAAREGVRVGSDFSSGSDMEAHRLLMDRGGGSNFVSLGRLMTAPGPETAAPEGGENAESGGNENAESAGAASPPRPAIAATLDPVLKKALEEIIEIKNQSDFVG